MKKKLAVKNTGFIILISVGFLVLLGMATFKQQVPKYSSNHPNSSLAPALIPSKSLVDDERFILNPPAVDASRSAKQQHARIVAKLAKIGDTLEIKDCLPTPLVLQLKQDTEFKIKNSSNNDIRIIFDEDHAYRVSANGSTTVKAHFKYYTGDYGYVCEKTGLVGFLHIIP